MVPCFGNLSKRFLDRSASSCCTEAGVPEWKSAFMPVVLRTIASGVFPVIAAINCLR